MNLELWNNGICCECKKRLDNWEKHFGICNECADKINQEMLKMQNKKHKHHRSLDE